MKRAGYLYDKIYNPENIRAAILNASKGKRRRSDVRRVLANIDQCTAELSDLLQREAWHPKEYTVAVVTEGSKNKKREIRKPAFWPDQVVHWAIYQVIGPHLYKGFYALSCGSVPGKGVHLGKQAVERWIKSDRKNTKYYLKMDVRHFYPSVRPDKLLELLGRKIKDPKALHIMQAALEGYDGLPIGVLLSQIFANFYLTPLDWHIKQDLHAVHYIRYMDDMVIFGRNKRKLHQMRADIAEYLKAYGMELKGNWQVCPLDKEPLDFMGFRFYRNRTTLRRAIMLRITRKIRKVDKKGRKATPKDAAAVISYMGWLKCTDTHGMYMKWVQPFLHIGRMKNLVRKAAKNREDCKKQQHS